MPVRQEIAEGLVPVKVYTAEMEPQARQQLVNISRLPIVHHHVAAMPDVHLGIGATVGSVIPTRHAIIPAAVGVDIGCGMMATRLSLTANELDETSLKKVFAQISRDVPVGFNSHSDRDARTDAAKRFQKGLKKILEKHSGIEKRVGRNTSWVHQLGTLGGGNHFIEICLDESDRVWAMLHSGSRGIGNAIGSYFIQLAKKDAERVSLALPDRDLAYFPEGAQHFDDYVERELHYGERVWLTRKGAIRAGAGELGIIPGSMGARSYIVRGKGSAESFHSCAHGAGRIMSRNAAQKKFNLEDLKQQTDGVICRKDKGVIDEIPGAYKNIDEVMANQSDLVDVVHTLKQVLCVKG